MAEVGVVNQKDTLFIFTNEFPYGNGESFIEGELSQHLVNFKIIKIFPLNKSGLSRSLNEKIIVVDLFGSFEYKSIPVFFRNTFLFCNIIFHEFYSTKSKYAFLKQFRTLKSILLRNFTREELVEDYLKNETNLDKTVFYSFWTDEWATILSVLKKKKIISDFISRVHGYDLYAERWPDSIIPFRQLHLENVSKILTASEDGLRYLTQNYSAYKSKFYLNHLTIFDHGMGPFNEASVFTVVSCSNLIPLKRVHLIAEMLREINFAVHWIHFGDGVDLQKIKALLENVGLNVTFDLKGSVRNIDVIQFYENNSVNLFIHLSETEGGVPLALQEAASFGIPLLGTTAGGAAEIVNEKTGVQLPIHIDKYELKRAVENFKNSEKNTIEFRKGVRAFWLNSFSADKNYSKLYDYLIK